MTLRIYGDLALQNQAALKLLDSAGSYSVQLRAPASLASDTTFQLPSSLGQNNQVMITDANGQFSFAFLSDANVASNAAIALSKLASVTVSRALVSDSNGVVSASDVTATEVGYLSGVTGPVQSQLDSEVAAREAADSDLEDALNQEVLDRQSAVSAEQSAREAAISAEEAAREAGDAGLQSQIDNILSNVDPAALDSLSEVVAAFQAADSDLTAAINALGTGATSALAAETARAEAAEAGLQSAIDSEVSARESAVSSEQAAREAADAALDDKIDQEIADREAAVSSEASSRASADQTLQQNIDAEASLRASAVSGEASAREAADTTLQSNIDAEVSNRQAAVSSEQSAREAADSAESAARVAGDQDLQDQIDSLESSSSAALAQEVLDRQTAVSSEQTAREAADTTLQGNIDTEKARIDAILLASDADKDSFAEIVQLINSVDTTNDSAFASYVLSNDAALAQEVSDRQAAVSSEQSAREAADTAESAARVAGDQNLQDQIDALDSGSNAALAQEISDRQAADATLQSNIDSEASARQSAISSEASSRQSADITLQSNIDSEASARQAAVSSEEAARIAGDNALDARLDVLEGPENQPGSVAKALADAKAYVNAHKATVDWMGGTSVTLTHNWNTKDVLVQVYDSTTGETITTDVTRSTNSVTCTASGPASMWRVIAFNIGTVSEGGGGGGGGGESSSAIFMSASFGPALGTVNWMAMGATTEYVRLEYDMAGFWLNVANLGPATTSSGYTISPLNNGGTYRLVFTDASGVTVVGSPSSTFIYTAAGGGGGGGGGPVFYSFPMIIGVMDNGDGTTNINWNGAMLPNAGVDLVYLVPSIGPGMYDDSAKVGLSMGMSNSANITTPASGTYVLKVYDAMGATVVTSASFQITNNALTQDGLGEGVGYISGTAVTGLTRLAVGTGSAVVDTFSETTFFGYHLFSSTFSQAQIDEFAATGYVAGETAYVSGSMDHTWTEVPTSGNYGGAMLGAKQGEARVFFWQGRHILARVVTP